LAPQDAVGLANSYYLPQKPRDFRMFRSAPAGSHPMPTLSKDLLRSALASVRLPDGRDLVSAGVLQWVAACESYGSVRLHLEQSTDDLRAALAAQCEIAVRRAAMQADAEVTSLLIEFVDHAGNVIDRAGQAPPPDASNADTAPARPQSAAKPGTKPAPSPDAASGPRSAAPTPQESASGLPGVTHIIAVGAGKGGVGKSSVAVNLAVGLARRGHAVGLLDGDIYGPSMPTMLGLDAHEQHVLDGKLQPFLVHGIKSVTIGKLVDPDKPLIWRGPMAHGAFNQLTSRTHWGELDYLIVDLPPGTGDVPLTLAQSLRLTGAVVVCTPQKVAQDDAVRAARMFTQLGIEVLGVVENMSYFIGDDGKEYDIFGRGGAEMMAQRLGLPFLGAVPITMALRQHSDAGEPLKNFDPAASGPALPRALDALVHNLEAQVTLAAMQQGQARPTLTIR
jgi:ATP-binding protein involved in chromosome partitioning